MDTFYLNFLMTMITTLIINIHTLQSHHMHDVTIPCTTSTLRYKPPSPREPICTPPFPQHCSPLLYSTFLRITFDFFVNPSPVTFLRHFLLFLMTSFSTTFFFVFIISDSPVHEGSLYLYQRTHADLPYPVSNVSYCISRHSSYLHRHFIKLF
jgi:hypothetical protein